MIPAFVVRVPSNRHEVEELHGVPDVEVFGISTDQVSTDEHIQDSTYEGYLFPRGDGLGIIPTSADPVDALPHSFSVFLELLVRRRHASPPFLYDSFFRMRSSGFQDIALFSYLLCLRRKTPLQLFQLLRQREVVQ